MNISFHFPKGEVSEWLIEYLRQQLLKLHHRDKEITRASAYLKEHRPGLLSEKTCAITLSIYGDEIFVKRSALTYDAAIREVFKELEGMVDARIKKQNEPPEERTSTVEV